MRYYDRYSKMRVDNEVVNVPFVKIPISNTDINIVFNKLTTRLDTLSYKYYGDSNYAWLILKANPQYGCYEFNIEDGSNIRIPYPLNDAINRYENVVENALNEIEKY